MLHLENKMKEVLWRSLSGFTGGSRPAESPSPLPANDHYLLLCGLSARYHALQGAETSAMKLLSCSELDRQQPCFAGSPTWQACRTASDPWLAPVTAITTLCQASKRVATLLTTLPGFCLPEAGSPAGTKGVPYILFMFRRNPNVF